MAHIFNCGISIPSLNISTHTIIFDVPLYTLFKQSFFSLCVLLLIIRTGKNSLKYLLYTLSNKSFALSCVAALTNNK